MRSRRSCHAWALLEEGASLGTNFLSQWGISSAMAGRPRTARSIITLTRRAPRCVMRVRGNRNLCRDFRASMFASPTASFQTLRRAVFGLQSGPQHIDIKVCKGPTARIVSTRAWALQERFCGRTGAPCLRGWRCTARAARGTSTSRFSNSGTVGVGPARGSWAPCASARFHASNRQSSTTWRAGTGPTGTWRGKWCSEAVGRQPRLGVRKPAVFVVGHSAVLDLVCVFVLEERRVFDIDR